MSTGFDLAITAYAESSTADLRLLDPHGSQLAYQHIDFKILSASHREGLFNLRNYLDLLVEDTKQAEAIAAIGVCIAHEVLGVELFNHLSAVATPRTLRILLPNAAADNALATQMARVPWEIARRAPDQPTLAERNLHIRVVNTLEEPIPKPLGLAPGEALRVLFVFAEARGSRPLEARRERRELLHLFKTKIYYKRQVVAHFLSHGVTQKRLEAQVRENGGYHIVHWSGHGSHNQLELARPGGGTDYLTGTGLLDLFNDAGGRLPQLVFLSACNSGEVLHVQDWQGLLALAQGQRPVSTGPAPAGSAPAANQLGYTGTAHALLSGGVPAVVAMRYAVGDVYARELAVQFYDALLAYEQSQPVAAALLTARKQLSRWADQSRFVPCDHATPVLYGAGQPDLTPLPGLSPVLSAHSPRLGAPVPELTIAEHQYFVGRTWELAGLGADFIGTGAGVKPVALVTGLGGMGKTALTAEALDLWEQRFKRVLLYQAKPNALHFEQTLHDIHLKLVDESKKYPLYIQEYHADAIYREPTDSFTGAARLDRLMRNLVRALQDEPMLLVFDNFESNLQPTLGPGPGAPRWACQDPAWDRCLTLLAAELSNSPSRVLITCRWPLAALAEGAYCPVTLGPLPASEAALYVRSHPGLLPMALGADKQEAKLVERLMNASRLHPLLMDRLARLAMGGLTLRPQLLEALAALETSHDYSQLPTLFAVERGNKQEVAYLEEALDTSLDLLIKQASPNACRLLWIISIANEPITLGLLASVWQEEVWPLLQEGSDALPEVQPLLQYLLATGLVNQQVTSQPENPNLTCHELVRECIQTRMQSHSPDKANLTENTIRSAYARRLSSVYRTLKHQDLASALLAGSRAIIYCIQAFDYEGLDSIASEVIASVYYSGPLAQLPPYLERAVQMAPMDGSQWRIRGYLADALCAEGQISASLLLYEEAVRLATAHTAANDPRQKQAWQDISWLTSNWARALYKTEQYDKEQQQRLANQIAYEKVGNSPISVLNNKAEWLRMDVTQGRAEHVIEAIKPLLIQLQEWLQQYSTNQPVQNIPDEEALISATISTLDVARQAARVLNDWEAALGYSETMLTIEETFGRPPEDMARARLNRATELKVLGYFDEAKAELQYCLSVFPDGSLNKGQTYGALGSLYWALDDLPQAIAQANRALAIVEQYDAPADHATIHDNLANYLISSASVLQMAIGRAHRIAALIYCLTANLAKHIPMVLQNCANDFATGEILIPSISELLSAPTFLPLAKWLFGRKVDLTELQTAVDRLLKQASQAATENL